MRWSAALIGLGLLCGCGRTAQRGEAPAENNLAGSAPTADDASRPGVGPIDASAQPAALAMTCEGRAESLAFKLPCLVGTNLNGPSDQPGYHVVECELAGQPDHPAVSFILPLLQIPELLHEPLDIPFKGVPAPPAGFGVTLDGERFAGSLSGIVTFTQVDVDGRAFVAQLEQGHVTWSGDQGGGFACSTLDGPLWAIAGGFI